jgi:hypothetical protein
MLGPVVGQMIFSITRYNFGLTFYIFSGLIAPFMILAWMVLPSTLNKRQQNGAGSVPHGEGGFIVEKAYDQPDYQFSYLKICLNFRAVLSLISAVVILVLTLFYDGIVAPRFV